MTTPMTTAQAPQSLLKPMRLVLRYGLLAGGAALLVGAGIGYLIAGVPGVWGAALGVGLAVAFFTFTVAASLVTARLQPRWLGLVVIVAWLIKMIALILILMALDPADFYNRPIFFASLLLCTFGYLGMEALIVTKTKVLYLETEFAPELQRQS